MNLQELASNGRPDRFRGYLVALNDNDEVLYEYAYPEKYFITDTFINFIDSDYEDDEKENLLNPLIYDCDSYEYGLSYSDLIHEDSFVDKRSFKSGLKKLKDKILKNKKYPFRKDIFYYSFPIDESIKFIDDNEGNKIVWLIEYY